MSILRRGSRGYQVERLQRLLLVAGFNPGAIDGVFGRATEAALIGFQHSVQLLPDAIYGPVTGAALEPGKLRLRVNALRSVDVDLVAEMFPFTRLDNIRRHLPAVIAALKEFRLIEKPLVLAALATIRAESERFEPIDEEPSRYNTSPGGHLYDLYDHRRDLGNQGPPDGERYHGRGFVQLTGRANYEDLDRTLGLDGTLVEQPELANDPLIASRCLAAFLAARREGIKRAVLEGDLARVRRLVNGGSHGLERFLDAWQRGWKALPDPVWPGEQARVRAA